MLSTILACALLGQPSNETYNQLRDRQVAEIHARHLKERARADQKAKDAMKPKPQYRIKSNGKGFFYRDSRGTMRYYDPGVRAVRVK